MASAADYGSTFGGLIFVQEVALLGHLLVRTAGKADVGLLQSEIESTASTPGEEPSEAEQALFGVVGDEDHLDDDTRFLFDVVARQNEGIVQNIDALDNGLIAVAVGVIAVTLFVADKWFDLDPNFRFAGLFFLSEAVVVALFGYLTKFFVGCGAADGVCLSEFAVDFGASAAAATSSAISDITRSGQANVVARRYKRSFLIVATLLAIAAAGVIVVGRALGPSSH